MSSSETPKDAPPPEQPAPAESSSSVAVADEPKDEEISFTVKSIADNKIPITVNRFISVADLKQKLAEPSSIPADRQRLIYSGRVLKDDQTLDNYKIQNGHTVHLVKGAASTASAARGAVGGSSASTSGAGAAGGSTGTSGATNPPQQLPSMAAGTGMNPLSRYANHIPLPSADMFGPDGGMGPPPNPEQMLSMMEQPEVRASMNALLQNPALLESLIQSNPMLQSMGPEVRNMMQSEEFRRMMTDPAIFRQMTQMQRMLGVGPFGGGLGGAGGASAFPAPGVTDQTPAEQQNQQQQAGNETTGTGAAGAPPINPFAALFNPFGAATQTPRAPSGAGSPGSPPPNPFMLFNPAIFGQQPPAGQTQTQTPGLGGEQTGAAPTGGAAAGSQQQPPNPFNPFLPPGGGGGGGGGGGLDLNQLQNMMQLLGMGPGGAGGLGGFGAPAAPVDNRPPEERYAEQLRQLNDMGFFDFDRNVAALRRSGGSVQGAIEYLLSGP
ncbi:hypothetical protein TWF225_011604 [Orbilia oligospora]|nr:hypothetical protein TWF225_011604 [Orbilia oligospora]KAF3192806.1 hypothetical protein TWF225_011604 [Orbilia oligospora]KAF3247176.1 hypothetical protein TWF128_008675 [Orbilia oligospora]KAF3247177.1 hypothetical protein TWF128_008675 [Orbilia oligospora]KAF3262850.1 hypothetical protein TWF217_004140 [Orbilia oligospora]